MFDFITPETAPWIMLGLWLVGLVCACKAGVMAERGKIWKDD